jgi:hypothetical protein
MLKLAKYGAVACGDRTAARIGRASDARDRALDGVDDRRFVEPRLPHLVKLAH